MTHTNRGGRKPCRCRATLALIVTSAKKRARTTVHFFGPFFVDFLGGVCVDKENGFWGEGDFIDHLIDAYLKRNIEEKMRPFLQSSTQKKNNYLSGEIKCTLFHE